MGKVLNFYHVGKVIPEGAVYLGRTMKKFGLIGHPLANPFPLNKEGSNREEVIEEYRQWLWRKLQQKGGTFKQLIELEGKDLVCFCSPKKCHCDVILSALEWVKTQRGNNDQDLV